MSITQMKKLNHKAVLSLLLCVLSCIVSLTLAELALRVAMPIRVFNVGTYDISAPNALIYGWGYAPGYEISQWDPDTHEKFLSRANSGGWKDVEHEPKKKPGIVRILILGDSNTFGMVPLKHTYPRVLEHLLIRAGFNAEIIAIGYGGWGTDAALMALKHSGLSYQPDIVISQFDLNDLTDNLPVGDMADKKPFRFELVDGRLKLHEVPLQQLRRSLFITRLKKWLLKSHIVFYTNAVRHKFSERITGDFAKNENKKSVRNDGGYWWEAYPTDPTTPYFPHHVSEKGSVEVEAAWLLYEKLVDEMSRLSKQSSAIFCLFNGVEEGHLAWEKRWHRIVEDDVGRDVIIWKGKRYPIYFYRHIHRITDIASRIGALMIPNKRTYTRFNTDPHPNKEGNQRMAEDIFDFLVTDGQTYSRLKRSHF